MDALLSDIKPGRAWAAARPLQLFKPEPGRRARVLRRAAISVRVVGNYHDLGAFASDIANLPRIVTLNNVQIAQDARERH